MNPEPQAFSRRQFVGLVVAGASGVSAAACASNDMDERGDRGVKGSVSGALVDLQGVAQAGFGQLILMYPTGQHVGTRATPDAAGRFRFADLAPGDFQLRFHASGQAIIPEPYQHPIKFAVQAGRVTDLTVRVVRGNFGQAQLEIYCGDDFYQLQPDGQENSETVVKLGSVVCWYNVGLKVHSVTGGPWNDSGDLQKTQSYIWVANQVGVFPYYCRYTQPQMRSTLRVVA